MIIKERKICSKCKDEKDVSEFSKDRSRKDGYAHFCKKCMKDYRQSDKGKNSSRKSIIKNKKLQKIYRQSEKGRALYKRYRQNEKGKEARRINQSVKYREDDEFRLKMLLRGRLNKALKSQNVIKSQKTLDLLGCDLDHLKQHLESQFQEGMSWENYGEWHIDHKKPCAAFDLTNENEQKECFNFKNLQPLWALDNLRKGAKFDEM